MLATLTSKDAQGISNDTVRRYDFQYLCFVPMYTYLVSVLRYRYSQILVEIRDVFIPHLYLTTLGRVTHVRISPQYLF